MEWYNIWYNKEKQERSGNYKFVRRGDSFRDRRRNFNSRRIKFSRNFKKRGGKLSQEKLNDELDNYFQRKGGESLKDYLDNDLEMYKNNAPMNENLKKETIALPPQTTEEKKVEEPKENVEVKNVEPQPENNPKPEEKVEEEKKDDKKKKKRGKK